MPLSLSLQSDYNCNVVYKTPFSLQGTKFSQIRLANRTLNTFKLPMTLVAHLRCTLWHDGPYNEHGGAATTNDVSLSLAVLASVQGGAGTNQWYCKTWPLQDVRHV